MSKVSLTSQIAALDAFTHRNIVVERGEKGRLHREHVKAAAETLRWLQRNEQTIKEILGNGK